MVDEMFQFLRPCARLDVKARALDIVLGLTGSEDGRAVLRGNREALRLLFDLTRDESSATTIARDAYSALLNCAASDDLAEDILSLDVLSELVSLVAAATAVEHDSQRSPLALTGAHVDKACMLISNLTRSEAGSKELVRVLTTSGGDGTVSLDKLVDVFDKNASQSSSVHYLATVFSNVTQLSSARKLFLDHSKRIVPRLLPYVSFEASLVRRGGIVGLIRNLCFEIGEHQWLLGEEVDLLPALLLPLAGPEQFSEEETERLPLDLQYLPDDKRRESDPDIRKMLIETIMQLCSTKEGRLQIKEMGAYLVARELHRWEEDKTVSATCENLIHMLISDEPAPGMENLHKIELPKEFLSQISNSQQS